MFGWTVFFCVVFIVLIIAAVWANRELEDGLSIFFGIVAVIVFGIIVNNFCVLYDQNVFPIEEPEVITEEYDFMRALVLNKTTGKLDGQNNIMHGDVQGQVTTELFVTIFYYKNSNETAQKELKLSQVDFTIVDTEEEEKYVIKKEVYYQDNRNNYKIEVRDTKIYYIVYITQENFDKYVLNNIEKESVDTGSFFLDSNK